MPRSNIAFQPTRPRNCFIWPFWTLLTPVGRMLEGPPWGLLEPPSGLLGPQRPLLDVSGVTGASEG
eukprot:4208786-Pyramimonas_sp.AAC.1